MSSRLLSQCLKTQVFDQFVYLPMTLERAMERPMLGFIYEIETELKNPKTEVIDIVSGSRRDT